MIANNWFDRDDARKWACLIAMMDRERVLWSRWWSRMRKFNCDDGRAHNWVRLWRWLRMGTPFDCNKVARTQQSTSSIAKTEWMHQLQAKSSCNCNSRSMRSTKMMFARANNHSDGRESERSRWCLREQTIAMMFARANDRNDRKRGKLVRSLQSINAIDCDDVRLSERLQRSRSRKLARSKPSIHDINRDNVRESEQARQSTAMRIAGVRTRNKQQSTSLWLLLGFVAVQGHLHPQHPKVLFLIYVSTLFRIGRGKVKEGSAKPTSTINQIGFPFFVQLIVIHNNFLDKAIPEPQYARW